MTSTPAPSATATIQGLAPPNLIKGVKWSGEAKAFRTELVELLAKHSGANLEGDEMLALAANALGSVVAIQDPRKMTTEKLDAIIAANLRAGNLATRVSIQKAAALKGAEYVRVPPPSPLQLRVLMGLGGVNDHGFTKPADGQAT